MPARDLILQGLHPTCAKQILLKGLGGACAPTLLSFDFVTKYAIRALVEQQVDTQYQVRKLVPQTITAKYSIRTLISQVLSTKYAVRKLVSQTLSTKYIIRKLVIKSFDIVSSIEAALLSFDFTTKYSIRSLVSQDLTTKYAVRKLVPQTTSTKYAIRSLVANTISTKYAIRKLVMQTLTAKYNIRHRVTQTFSTKYAIRARITQTFSTKYAIRKLVQNTFTTKYAIRKLIIKSFDIVSTIGGILSFDFTTKYAIRSLITQDLVAKYSVRKLLSQTITAKYAIRNVIEQILSTKYIIRKLLEVTTIGHERGDLIDTYALPDAGSQPNGLAFVNGKILVTLGGRNIQAYNLDFTRSPTDDIVSGGNSHSLAYDSGKLYVSRTNEVDVYVDGVIKRTINFGLPTDSFIESLVIADGKIWLSGVNHFANNVPQNRIYIYDMDGNALDHIDVYQAIVYGLTRTSDRIIVATEYNNASRLIQYDFDKNWQIYDRIDIETPHIRAVTFHHDRVWTLFNNHQVKEIFMFYESRYVLEAKYAIRKLVIKSFDIVSLIEGVLQITFTTKYAIRSLISQTVTAKYQVRKLVSQDGTTKYAIRSLVSQTISTIYDLAGGLVGGFRVWHGRGKTFGVVKKTSTKFKTNLKSKFNPKIWRKNTRSDD